MSKADTPGMSLHDIGEMMLQEFLKLSPEDRVKANKELVAEAEAYLQAHPQPKAKAR